jgi:hypothetical protein
VVSTIVSLQSIHLSLSIGKSSLVGNSQSPFSYVVFRADTGVREVSLTAPPPTNAAGRQLTSADGTLTEEDFYHAVDENLTKVENFTLEKVTSLRAQIAAIEKEVNAVNSDDEKAKDTIRNKADSTAKAFLTLEKYVNSKLDC